VARRKRPGDISEKEFQTQITQLADLTGWKWHHETDSRKSKSGFPDLVLVGRGRTLFRELKTDYGVVRPEQQEWIDVLVNNGTDAKVWRPSDWDEIEATLKGSPAASLPLRGVK
jgi:hypothetical protein